MVNADYDIIDRVYYEELISTDHSIESLGDALTGGDVVGDNETITFSLNTVDSVVETLYIIISIYDMDDLVFY